MKEIVILPHLFARKIHVRVLKVEMQHSIPNHNYMVKLSIKTQIITTVLLNKS